MEEREVRHPSFSLLLPFFHFWHWLYQDDHRAIPPRGGCSSLAPTSRSPEGYALPTVLAQGCLDFSLVSLTLLSPLSRILPLSYLQLCLLFLSCHNLDLHSHGGSPESPKQTLSWPGTGISLLAPLLALSCSWYLAHGHLSWRDGAAGSQKPSLAACGAAEEGLGVLHSEKSWCVWGWGHAII